MIKLLCAGLKTLTLTTPCWKTSTTRGFIECGNTTYCPLPVILDQEMLRFGRFCCPREGSWADLNIAEGPCNTSLIKKIDWNVIPQQNCFFLETDSTQHPLHWRENHGSRFRRTQQSRTWRHVITIKYTLAFRFWFKIATSNLNQIAVCPEWSFSYSCSSPTNNVQNYYC